MSLFIEVKYMLGNLLMDNYPAPNPPPSPLPFCSWFNLVYQLQCVLVHFPMYLVTISLTCIQLLLFEVKWVQVWVTHGGSNQTTPFFVMMKFRERERISPCMCTCRKAVQQLPNGLTKWKFCPDIK